MSVTCESIGSEDEFSQSLSNSKNNGKGSFEEEELDYEEEMDDSKSNTCQNNLKNEEEGELSDNVNTTTIENLFQTKGLTEKDEGELDEDEDLEEGEVKEADEENEVNEQDDNERNKNSATQNNQNSSRQDIQKHGKSYYNNSYWPNQGYNSRYINHNRSERFSNNRVRDYNPAHQSTSLESAWERGLKQARELLSKASKRKEEEVDFDNKRLNLTVDNVHVFDQSKIINNLEVRDPSPVKRRRHSSQRHSSSEDEVERRHRLAYDAAPWNNQSSSHYQSSNYRNKSNYSYNRSAETYRDPWRRSKSPKFPLNRNRKQEYDKNDDIHKKVKNPDSRSNSMSSLSSIDTDSSNFSGSEKSNGRKLPYSRPILENKGRQDNECELPFRNDYPKSRMDRIPKKSNVSSHYQSNERISETKSFDSWSESLSDSDSSSFYSNSDSDSDESDVDNSARKSSKISKKLSEKRSQSKLNKHIVIKTNENTPSHLRQLNKEVNIESRSLAFPNSKSSRSNQLEKETNKKAPIKMTFMKTQTPLKLDKLIDEQLNGETFELEDMDTNISVSSKHSSVKSVASKSQSEDEESKNSLDVKRTHKDSSSSSASSSNKLHRREELLLKLKAVEEAIERKLNSKKE